MLTHLEYIWLDGNTTQHLRSKTKIIKSKNIISSLYREYKQDISKVPKWNFDGSSTNQADTQKSELFLVPVNVFLDPFKPNGLLILCEVTYPNGDIHPSNTRAKLRRREIKEQEVMLGLEQEYIIYDKNTNKPLGWPSDINPDISYYNTHITYPSKPQGDYYCGIGGDNVVGRAFVEEHANLCEICELELSGINAEVMLGQWEYQIGPVYALDGSDQLWISRYLLERLSEKYNYYIELHPKPYVGNDWNGSGMHLNFSTKEMRTDMKNKKILVIEACEKIGKNIDSHIAVYGEHNHLRLTGANETSSINEFKYGIGDRTASIRIPSSIEDATTPGYFEDRRPASNADPYLMVERMIRTINS